MKTLLNEHRFQADGFELPFFKLLEFSLPAIVLIDEKGYRHFVVIKGRRDGRILIGDACPSALSDPSQSMASL